MNYLLFIFTSKRRRPAQFTHRIGEKLSSENSPVPNHYQLKNLPWLEFEKKRQNTVFRWFGCFDELVGIFN